MHNIADNMLVDVAGETTELGGTTLNGSYYDMTEYDMGAFLATLYNPSGLPTPSGRLVLAAAEDAVGTGREIVATYTDDLITTFDEDVKALVEFRTEDLPDGKPFARLEVSELNGEGATMDVTIVAAHHNPHRKYANKLGADLLFQTWES